MLYMYGGIARKILAVGVYSAFLMFGLNAYARIEVVPIPLKDGPPILLVKGEFELNDDPKFLAQAADVYRAELVSFNSNGGNIVAAMAFGRTIRKLGLSTAQLRSSECASACTLAFIGGVRREAEPGSIGVHQSSFAPGTNMDGPTAAAEVQALTANLISYFEEMGVDSKILQLSLATPSTDMRYLTSQEMDQYHVTTTNASTPPQSAQPPSAGPSLPTVTSQSPDAEAEQGATAQKFVLALIDASGASKDQVLKVTSSVYGDFVTYFGKAKSRGDVLAEKAHYIDRWPIRYSNVRLPSVTTTCANNVCLITGIYDWQVVSPERNKKLSGTAVFEYQINMLGSARIISEGGHVLSRD